MENMDKGKARYEVTPLALAILPSIKEGGREPPALCIMGVADVPAVAGKLRKFY